MKKIPLIIIIITLIYGGLFAQDQDYKGPAKMYVSTFWRVAEMAKSKGVSSTTVQNLEKSLTETKQKDPDYNTSAMEAELAKWKEADKAKKEDITAKEEKKEADNKAKFDAIKGSTEANKLCDELFVTGSLDISGNSTDAEKWKEKIAAFRQKADKIIEYKNAGTKLDEASYVRYISKDNLDTDNFIKRQQDAIKGTTDPNKVNSIFYETKLHLIYWQYVNKIFTGHSEFVSSENKLQKLADELGNLESLKNKANTNNEEIIKSTMLPKAVMSDANIEKMFIDGFNKKYQTEYKGTAYKAIILQSEWTVKRNNITDAITERTRQGAIVYKDSSGKCFLIESIYLCEQYVSGKFQNPYVAYPKKAQEMLCGNVK